MVFQIQLAKTVGAVPLTRDYLFEAERKVTPFFDFPTFQSVRHSLPLRDTADVEPIDARGDPARL
jgi:hypothetical protein